MHHVFKLKWAALKGKNQQFASLKDWLRLHFYPVFTKRPETFRWFQVFLYILKNFVFL